MCLDYASGPDNKTASSNRDKEFVFPNINLPSHGYPGISVLPFFTGGNLVTSYCHQRILKLRTQSLRACCLPLQATLNEYLMPALDMTVDIILDSTEHSLATSAPSKMDGALSFLAFPFQRPFQASASLSSNRVSRVHVSQPSVPQMGSSS